MGSTTPGQSNNKEWVSWLQYLTVSDDEFPVLEI